MVTRILFDPRRDLTDGTTTSSPVTIEATPTGIREDGSVVIYPGTLTFTISTGADVFQLPANQASNAWRIVVRQNGIVRQQRTVRVPNLPSITWTELPDVDPASLQINPGTALQWDATFWAIIQFISSTADGGTTPTVVAAELPDGTLNLSGVGVIEGNGVIILSGPNVAESNGVITIS